MLVTIISFILGAALTSVVFILRQASLKEELIKLRAKCETSENLQEIIKRDFVQLANETIKNEQEDLRKQNRETLEEKILPLTRELGEFKAKVEHFNLKGTENTRKQKILWKLLLRIKIQKVHTEKIFWIRFCNLAVCKKVFIIQNSLLLNPQTSRMMSCIQ